MIAAAMPRLVRRPKLDVAQLAVALDRLGIHLGRDVGGRLHRRGGLRADVVAGGLDGLHQLGAAGQGGIDPARSPARWPG